MAIYKDSTGRKMTLTEAMALSQLYIGVVTHNFIEDVRNDDTRILKEIETAKAFKLSCVLFYFDNLTEADKKLAEKLFHDHKIIKKYENVPYDPGKFHEWSMSKMPEIKKLAEGVALKGNKE